MADLEALARGEVRGPYATVKTPARGNYAPSPPPPSPQQHGLTWGVLPAAPKRFVAHCHGAPKSPMDQLHSGSCNPYRGDTLCTVHLPVLCFAPARLELALSAPTLGADLRPEPRRMPSAPAVLARNGVWLSITMVIGDSRRRVCRRPQLRASGSRFLTSPATVGAADGPCRRRSVTRSDDANHSIFARRRPMTSVHSE